MRALVLSSTFPNPKQPTLGVFIRERLRRVAHRADLRVVAPIPWFPMNRLLRGARAVGIPAVEQQHGLQVYHPRFLCVPGHLKWLDGVLYGLSLIPFLLRLRREFPFDLIDAHFAYPDGVAGVLLGRVLRRPVVITLRGSIVRLATYPSHRPQLRWALERADRIMAVSQSLADVAGGLGIPQARIRVVPNGVDTVAFRPGDQPAARRACGLPLERRVILTVGGIYADKGQHLVLEALPALLRRHPDLLYVMVGDFRRDAYRDRLEAIIERGALGDRVRLAGLRPHQELPAWYQAADIFCLPTRSEGWANVLLEALACGVPVVATRVGGNPEIIRDERCGLLVPFGDATALGEALGVALETRWDRQAMVTHAATHTWEGAAEQVLEEFTAARAASPAPAPLAGAAGRRAR